MPDALRQLTETIRYSGSTVDLAEIACIRTCTPDEIPEIPRRLLVHDRDMTSTLEAHYGTKLQLRVLHRSLEAGVFVRQVVLETSDTQRPVELGAIRMHLEHFDHAPRREIEACIRPLGAILESYQIPYNCRPGEFFVTNDRSLADAAFGMEHDEPLYGRWNTILTPESAVLADVIEILAPLVSKN